MKKIKNKKYKFLLLALIVVSNTLYWSCSKDEDADKISVTPQQLPTVTSITPDNGVLGTEVTITGEQLSHSSEDITVTFEGTSVSAEITSSSETSITTIVPSGAVTGDLKIKIGVSQVLGGPLFTVPFPEIISYSTTNGIFGTEVIITGANFSEIINNNTVTFNGVEAEIIATTPTTLTVIIPFGATTGAVEVNVDEQISTGPEFTVPAPTILDYDISSGNPGVSVTISGTNFSTNPDDNIVSFNGTTATVTSATATTIVTSVPVGASTGTITVNVGGQEAIGTEFTVTGAVMLIIPLTSNDDDVEEIDIPSGSNPQGDMDIGSSDLELGELSSGQGLMKIGLRYNNVTIPQGTVVSEAYIQFRCDAVGADPVELTIYAEDNANSAPFEDILFNVSTRPLTASSVIWTVPEWENTGDRGLAQRTINIASVIQEVVDRADWVSGNSISIIIRASGVSLMASSASGGREAENYSSSVPDDGAELTIIY